MTSSLGLRKSLSSYLQWRDPSFVGSPPRSADCQSVERQSAECKFAECQSMIHLFVNALAASAGGGLTYVRNVIPQIAARNDAMATILLDKGLRQEFQTPSNIEFLEWEGSSQPALRFWLEQRTVRRLALRSGAGVLLSAGNFAVWNSPLPQLLLSRNSLYTSRDFDRDLRSRGETRLWLDTRLKAEFAKWSILAADRVVAPSQSFAEELQRWTGAPISAVHHGFDREMFLRDNSPLPDRRPSKTRMRRRRSSAVVCQPLQLLPQFRDADPRPARDPAGIGAAPGSSFSYLQACAGRQSRSLSSRASGGPGSSTEPVGRSGRAWFGSVFASSPGLSIGGYLRDPGVCRILCPSFGRSHVERPSGCRFRSARPSGDLPRRRCVLRALLAAGSGATDPRHRRFFGVGWSVGSGGSRPCLRIQLEAARRSDPVPGPRTRFPAKARPRAGS